jgi:hypothetical protein
MGKGGEEVKGYESCGNGGRMRRGKRKQKNQNQKIHNVVDLRSVLATWEKIRYGVYTRGMHAFC